MLGHMRARRPLQLGPMLCSVALLLLAHCQASSKPGATSSLGSAVDLSETKHFPPIFDQGSIGSCDWFAVVYYQMTFMQNRAHDRAAAPSNTFSPQFGYNMLNNGGSFPYKIRVDDVYKFSRAHGSATLAEFPYDQKYEPWCTDGSIWEAALQRRIADYHYFTLRDEAPGAAYSFQTDADFVAEIRRLIGEGEVLVVQFMTWAGITPATIADDPSTSADDAHVGEAIVTQGNKLADHTLAVVGYDDDVWVDVNGDGTVQADEKGALKIADSYDLGSTLHNNGFLWMAYRAVPSSFWLSRVNRMTLRPPDYAPKVIARVTLNAWERDKIQLQLGRSTGNTPQDVLSGPARVVDPVGPGFTLGTSGESLIAGAPWTFDGTRDAAGDGSFAYDLTDIAGDDFGGWWYLRIRNGGDKPVVVKRLEIVNSSTGQAVSDTGVPVTLGNEEAYRFVRLQ
jgi:hypothetical protein